MVRTVISTVERVAEIVAEMVAAKVAEKVAEYLVDPVKLHFGYLFNSHNHVTDLLQKIDDLGLAREKAVKLVEEATQQGDVIPSDVQEWLKATEGILQTGRNFDQDLRASEGRFHPRFRYNLSRRAKRHREDCDVKLQQAHKFCETVSKRRRLTNDDVFPSRQSIFDQVMEALGNEQTSIVGVWGMGGVGKTYLARQVAKRAEKENLFDKVVMASSISQTPIISDIQTELARTLGLTFREGQDRAVALTKSLKNQKKVLVILDDIWDKLDLEKIGIPYGDDHRGCKMLLTSREREVVATDMKAQQVFRLLHLEQEEARSLFKGKAGNSVESPELKATADDILEKCKGLPLAIITIADALKNMSVGEWENALMELKNAKPTSIRGVSESVYSLLELSYNRLKGGEIKSLFLLCGLLGGHRISKDDLVLYATGLDMFEGIYSMQQVINKLITLVRKLRDSSLLLEAEGGKEYRHWYLFQDPFVTMHDVVRDVARSIASQDGSRQYVVSEAVELREWERRGERKNYSRISLEWRDSDELPQRLVCPELEFFLLNTSFTGRPKLEIPENFFQEVTKLKVLHLSSVSIKGYPSPLRVLSNLRTLCLTECYLSTLTIIGEMKRLQVLSLAKSWFYELPEEIGQLKYLRVLDLEDCSGLRIIPRNVISSLTGLECLNLLECYSIQWGNSNAASVSEIKDLPPLRSLGVEILDPSLLPDDIGLRLVNLARHVICIGTKKKFSFPYGPRRNMYSRNLMASGVKIPVLKSFSNLFKTCQLVMLECLDGISNLVYDLANENGFPQLEFLRIEECSTIRHIVSFSVRSLQKWIPPRDTFCSLDQLELYRLQELQSVLDFHESASIPIECFSKLSRLTLTACEKLRCVVYLPMQHGEEVNFFPQLKMLKLDNLPSLIGLYSATTPEPGEVPVSILFNEKASYLALEKIYVQGCPLRVLWHNQLPAHSFSKLKELKVENCNVLKKVLPVSLAKALVQLETLVFWHCESLEKIIANIEGDEDIEDEATFFPKLTHLELKDLVLLKRFCSLGIKLRWPLLKELSVEGCGDQVRTVYEEIDLEGDVDAPLLFLVEKEAFPDLETLEISTMKGVLEIWRGQFSRFSFSKLRKLSIKDCHDISFVISRNMVQTLSNLEDLWVKSCDSLKEVIQLLDDEPTQDEICFSKLKSMRLNGVRNWKRFCSATCTIRFPSLEELCVGRLGHHLPTLWQDQFPADWFSQLKTLKVEGWHELQKAFPVSLVKALGQLERLTIIQCKSLEEIVANNTLQDIEDDQAMFFPKLVSLCLENLRLLKRFCSQGIKLRWPLLNDLRIEGCDQVKVVFEEIGLEGEVDAPPLLLVEKEDFLDLYILVLRKLNGVVEIWRGQFSWVSFSKLRMLHISNCQSISFVISKNMVQTLHNLEDLYLGWCDSMKEVIQLLDDEPTIDEIHFNKLRGLELFRLPNLKGFCSATCKFQFPLLERLSIYGCPKMEFFCKGGFDITNDIVKEKISSVLPYNAGKQARQATLRPPPHKTQLHDVLIKCTLGHAHYKKPKNKS